jgi:hypothetical protein
MGVSSKEWTATKSQEMGKYRHSRKRLTKRRDEEADLRQCHKATIVGKQPWRLHSPRPLSSYPWQSFIHTCASERDCKRSRTRRGTRGKVGEHNTGSVASIGCAKIFATAGSMTANGNTLQASRQGNDAGGTGGCSCSEDVVFGRFKMMVPRSNFTFRAKMILPPQQPPW